MRLSLIILALLAILLPAGVTAEEISGKKLAVDLDAWERFNAEAFVSSDLPQGLRVHSLMVRLLDISNEEEAALNEVMVGALNRVRQLSFEFAEDVTAGLKDRERFPKETAFRIGPFGEDGVNLRAESIAKIESILGPERARYFLAKALPEIDNGRVLFGFGTNGLHVRFKRSGSYFNETLSDPVTGAFLSGAGRSSSRGIPEIYHHLFVEIAGTVHLRRELSAEKLKLHLDPKPESPSNEAFDRRHLRGLTPEDLNRQAGVMNGDLLLLPVEDADRVRIRRVQNDTDTLDPIYCGIFSLTDEEMAAVQKLIDEAAASIRPVQRQRARYFTDPDWGGVAIYVPDLTEEFKEVRSTLVGGLVEVLGESLAEYFLPDPEDPNGNEAHSELYHWVLGGFGQERIYLCRRGDADKEGKKKDELWIRYAPDSGDDVDATDDQTFFFDPPANLPTYLRHLVTGEVIEKLDILPVDPDSPRK